ncbi:hypothetical protein HPP92_017683 [Vanilla planifolia]|uniref:Uncharacterized protein n=1 Tax=Vanilla planifolia TaxID=51239 RepID=A0A835ULQ8_VANPL|nr:hypothetical protein HPP92_017683 [Vanilla planifolia]
MSSKLSRRLEIADDGDENMDHITTKERPNKKAIETFQHKLSGARFFALRPNLGPPMGSSPVHCHEGEEEIVTVAKRKGRLSRIRLIVFCDEICSHFHDAHSHPTRRNPRLCPQQFHQNR